MAILNVTTWVKKVFGLRDATALTGFYGENYSGKNVNSETALALSAVWACVGLIARSIAALPVGVFENDDIGDKKLLRNSELYRILHSSPNANMTAYHFWMAVVGSILLWGNSYNLKTFRGTGSDRKLVSLEPLDPKSIQIRENNDGSFTYIHSTKYGRTDYSEDQIAHFKGLSLNGRVGLSVLRFAANTFGNSMAQEETSGKLFANGMRPGGALTVAGELKADQREQIRTNLSNQVGGVARTGGIIVLEHGMKYESLSIPPEDAQMLESRAFSIEEVCRWFGVPPVLIGHNDKTTSWGTGIEQINLGFLQYTINPLLVSMEQEVTRSVFSASERVKQFMQFNIEGFLRADSEGRAALYSSGAQNGWLKRSEIRRKENLEYVEGSEQLTAQSNLLPLDKLGETTVQPQNRRASDPGNAS